MARRGRGEGTIYRCKDGRWAGEITIGWDPDGKRIYRKVYGRTRREAQEKLAELRERARKGSLQAEARSGRLLFGDWLRRWLEDYKRVSLRPTTWASYLHTAERHIIPEIGRVPLRELRTADLQRLYADKLKGGRLDGKGGLSTRTVRYIHQVIRGALEQAVKEGLLDRNPAGAAELPRLVYREARPLTKGEALRFLEAARGHWLYPAFLLELTTGLRRGELLALRWEDVDLEEGWLHVRRTLTRAQNPGGAPARTAVYVQEPKTERSRRAVPIPGVALDELRRLHAAQGRPAEGWVFRAANGSFVEPRNLLRAYKRILKKAGLPDARFHDLRHTVGNLLLEAGEDLKLIQELFGHARLAITADIYTKVSPDLKRRASARLDGIFRQDPGHSPEPAGPSGAR